MSVFIEKSESEEQLLSDLTHSLLEGDMPRARRLLFGEISESPRAVNSEVAKALRWGLNIRFSDAPLPPTTTSFMHVCARQGHVDLVREVLKAKHPETVEGIPTATAREWLDFLCTSWSFGLGFQPSPLLTIILALSEIQDRPGFFAIALDYMPRDVLAAELDKRKSGDPASDEHFAAIQTCGLQVACERRLLKRR